MLNVRLCYTDCSNTAAMSKQTIDKKHALVWRAIFTVALIAIGAFFLEEHHHIVSQSIADADGMNGPWFLCSLLLMAATFCIAAGTYSVLAFHRLRYRQTLLVELAAAFANRLLPAGLGGLGLNGVYLYRHNHTPAEATAIVSVNNLLGMAAHLLLLVALLLYHPRVVQALCSRHGVSIRWEWGALAVAVLAVVCSVPPLRRKLARFAWHLIDSFRQLSAWQIVPALLLSALLTITYTLVLCCAARAIDVRLGVQQLFIVFSFGMLVGTAVPTPGGLVGTEAALFTALAAYGVSDAHAGAVVVLFRLATYWLPLVPGVYALWSARYRHLL